MIKTILSTVALITMTTSQLCQYESSCNGNAPCVDLIQHGTYHHVMSLVSTNVASVIRVDTSTIWSCTCSGCNGLVGNWNCPGFYNDEPIVIASDTEDLTTSYSIGCIGDCQSEVCLLPPTVSPTTSPTVSPTVSPTPSPTTEYTGGYSQGKADEKAAACEKLNCCQATRRRLFELEKVKDDIENEYLEMNLKLQDKYFKYVLLYVICSLVVVLYLLIRVCRKNRKIKELQKLIRRANPGSIV